MAVTEQEVTTNTYEGLKFRCVGPHRGGRVVAVAGHPTEQQTFYFGACSGGVWKSIDGGQYWENVSDGFFGTAAIGAIQIAESDPNVIYVGTGETAIRGNVSHGDGVYKSTDGGKTWKNVGLKETRYIGRIRIHPQNPDVVYVAALGHAYGPNPERGVYRSTDGGQTWEQVLFRSEKAGAIDLSMDPNNPRILYASLWEVQRYPYTLTSGGEGSGIFKSTDGGDTWTELTRNPGLPKGVLGKIGVAVSPANPNRVWALIEAKDGALFRSDDAGETWQRLSESDDLRYRAWYYMHLFADPQDQETCWVLNLSQWKSTDGGATFSEVPTAHGDNHDLWIDPRNPQRMIQGNDGGACVTFNGAISWSTLWNQPTAQFYHVTTDNRFPYRLYGSQQDNSAMSVPSASINGAISSPDWFVPGGGESGHIAVKPSDENIIVAGAIGSGFGNGLLWRYDHRTGHEYNVTVWPEVTSGVGMGASGADSLKYRFQWTFPVLYSPHNPDVLYVTSNHVHRSTDDGQSWEVISPDLTRNDKSKQGASGGPITKDNTGAEIYDTIFAFVESPHEAGVFWAGSDDGLVHLSRDGGKSWNKVTPPDLPEWALITTIEVSPHDPATAYVAATRYKHDDFTPYLFKTTDYGATWQRITNGIPDGDFTRAIREDSVQQNLLFAGTETGLYVSFDGGAEWERLQSNLPVVPIHDFVVKNDDLVVATHGRSFWILDDLSTLRQIAQQRALDGVRLFAPRDTVRFFAPGSFWMGARPDQYIHYTWAGPVGAALRLKVKPDGTAERHLLDAGQNPPGGAIVTYYLPEKPEGDVTLTFLTMDGTEIKQFKSLKPPKSKDDEDESSEAAEAEAAATEGGEGTETPAGSAQEAAAEAESEEEAEPKLPKDKGFNRFAWNLRYEGAKKIPKDKSVGFMFPGPAVLSGQYQVRLEVDGQTYTETFNVVPDPRNTASQEDLQKQFDLLMEIRAKVTQTHEAIIQLRDIKGQVEAWAGRLKDREDARPIAESAKALAKRLSEVEDALVQKKAGSALQYPDGLNAMLAVMPWFCDFSDGPPTRQTYEAFESLSGKVDEQLNKLADVIGTDLEVFNKQVRDASVPAVVVKTPTKSQAEMREPAAVGDDTSG